MTPDVRTLVLTLIVPTNRAVILPSDWTGKRVTVKLGRDSRSNQQNRWYRGVALPLLADHLGYDMHEREDLHEAVLMACFGSRISRADGREVPMRRTSDLDTREMAEFQDWFSRWCASVHGVNVPMPNEAA